MNAATKKRFINNINDVVFTNCWEWVASTDGTGYGMFYINGKIVKAHRASWQLYFGEIPPSMLVLHKCDNRKCINPRHLFLGNHKDNSQDMIKKGRNRPVIGEAHGMSRLKEPQVSEIKKLIKSGMAQRKIAAKFFISAATVCNISKKRYWTHVL